MKRCILLIVSLCFTIVAICDVHVTFEEAQGVASTYYQKVRKEVKGDQCKVGSPIIFSLLGLADMWLVPVNDSWILVSTDKRTEAVLARFTTPDMPDLQSYPPAAKYLISCYEHEIQYVRDSCKDCSIKGSWEKQPKIGREQTPQNRSIPLEVEPLLEDLAWKQSGNSSYLTDCEKVYNKFCPPIISTDSDLCGFAAAGCISIAIAQIMRYWQWPYAADVPTTVGGNIKVKKFYNWNLMPQILYNSSTLDETNMTAGFIRDCGYDLGMHYGEQSGVLDIEAVNTLKRFGYDENSISLKQKWLTPGWTNMLHEEIAAGRPVYYGGYETVIWTGGHAFILDGYDAEGLYHANIGWGPGYNDYYFIDTITVYNSSFSHWQSAIIGIQPDNSYCTSLTVTSVETPKFCIAQAGTITFDGVNINNCTEGKVFSSEAIILTNGTQISNGTNVLLTITPIPCSPPIQPMSIAVRSTDNTESLIEKADYHDISLKYANELIELETTEKISMIFLYSIDGKMIKQDKSSMIATNLVPNGAYIIKAISENGLVFQTKLVLQR